MCVYIYIYIYLCLFIVLACFIFLCRSTFQFFQYLFDYVCMCARARLKQFFSRNTSGGQVGLRPVVHCVAVVLDAFDFLSLKS